MKYQKTELLNRYCRQIGRKLTCSRQTKKDLLEGYRAELEEQLPEDISKDTLLEKYGSSASVAAELQNSINEEEAHRAKKCRLYCWIAAAVSIVLLCGALLGWYIHYRNNTDIVYYKETIHENSEVFEDSNEIFWGS